MIWVRVGAFLAAAGVALGAFGAHGLKARLTPELLDIYKTAVFYHLIHALAVILTGILMSTSRESFPGKLIAMLFVFGILFFSGSLYGLAITNSRWLGAITPLGGISFIAAWIVLALNIK